MSTASKIAGAEFPDGWRMVRLGDIADVAFSGVDKRTMPEETPVLLCNYTDVFYNQRITPDMDFMPATATDSERERWQLKKGDVIFTKDSETADEIGIPSVVAEDMPGVLCGYHLGVARPSPALVDGPFLAAALNSTASRHHFTRVANGVTRFGLTLDAARSVPVLLPPPPEQRAIAEVLDSIDKAIERTEAVIAATENLRDSLLHELLTRGVPGWHTEWKDVSGIGTMPADWEVVRLGEIIPRFDYGTSIQCNSDPSGIPVLRIPNIASGELDLSDLKYASLSPSEIAKLHLAAGDILLVRTNGNPEICGRSWVTGGLDGQWAFASYLVRGRPDPSRVKPAFVGHFMGSDAGRRFLRGHIRTSAGNYNLSVGDLGSIPFPCPPLDEQVCIVDSIGSTTELIDGLRSELGRLNSTKRASADALLTGHARVCSLGSALSHKD